MGNWINKIMGYGASTANTEALSNVLSGGEVGEVEKLMDAAYNALSGAGKHILGFQCKHPSWHGEYPETLNDVVKLAEHPDAQDGYLVFMPPASARRWYRWNDDIDYAEVAVDMIVTGDSDLETSTLFHNSPLYPYLDWMNSKTGEKVSMDVPNFQMREIYGDKIAPFVPEAVRVISDHLTERGVVEEKFWLKLRPMIVTWWC